VKALFRGPQGQVPSAALLAAAGYPEAPARQVPEAIRLWQEAEAAESGARPGVSRDARRGAVPP
jgi:hypothetical protein